jgi:hypothetical protein
MSEKEKEKENQRGESNRREDSLLDTKQLSGRELRDKRVLL